LTTAVKIVKLYKSIDLITLIDKANAGTEDFKELKWPSEFRNY